MVELPVDPRFKFRPLQVTALRPGYAGMPPLSETALVLPEIYIFTPQRSYMIELAKFPTSILLLVIY